MSKDIPRKDDIPVTVKMFSEFRAEIYSKLDSFDAKLSSFDAKLSSFDFKLNSFDSKLNSVESNLGSKIHQIQLLIETQNAQNVIALDGVRHALAEVASLRADIAANK